MSNTIAPMWVWPPQLMNVTNSYAMAAFATACGRLHMICTDRGDNVVRCYLLGSDLLWYPTTPITANTSDAQPALISLDELLYAFIPLLEQDKLSVYSLNLSAGDGWTHLCDYNVPSGSNSITGVVHDDLIVLVQMVAPGLDASEHTLNCITMSTKDISDPMSWSTSTEIDGKTEPSCGISMYIRKDAHDGAPNGSIRFMYFDTGVSKIQELTLDIAAMTWYPSPIPVPGGNGIPHSGIGAAASPDGMLVWANFQPDDGHNKVEMFSYSVARKSSDWLHQFTFQVDWSYGSASPVWNPMSYPMSITYLYGDLIAVWLNFKAIRFTMQRPGGYFDLTCWMKTIDDLRLVSELSIPGTHASATSSDLTLFTSNNSFERRQNMNIIQQLNAGIRFLHFIVGISGESGSQTLSLYTPKGILINYRILPLMVSIFNWLNYHPSEGVILFFSPLDAQQSPAAMISALNTAISPYLSYFTPTSSAPTVTMGQLRNKILLMHNLDQECNSQTSISAGIDLGTSYPDPTIKQIVSFTTEYGIPFIVQDYAMTTGSASEVETDIKEKSALVVAMLEKTAETGTVSPTGETGKYPPLLPNTWYLNWMNFNVLVGFEPSTTNDSLKIARSINPSVTAWLEGRNSSTTSADWWPRVGIIISDFSEVTDGSMISRIVSMNGFKYMRYSNSNTIPPGQG